MVEQYTLLDSVLKFGLAAHLDLYRLVDPEELYFIGFDEIATQSDILLIEWPDKGAGQLPNATHTVMIGYSPDANSGARDIEIIEH